ncbi:MAG: hypothetical protein HZA14_02780 [Nitrospirae bacterium]|nr:hypothetical protein [Nitrospirota bacterium]
MAKKYSFNILENIALIASIISAITAVTTSLRAMGKARESAQDELIKTGCRTADYRGGEKKARMGGLFQHFISTVIWFILSVVFAAPLLIQKWKTQKDAVLFFWCMPFLLLIVLLWLIWRKAVTVPR